jgi:hypothetical protein
LFEPFGTISEVHIPLDSGHIHISHAAKANIDLVEATATTVTISINEAKALVLFNL